METVNLTVAVLRRFNLGNYEHVEGRIEMVLPPCPEAEADKRIAAAQARILQHLTVQALTGAGPAPQPAPAAPPPAQPPAAPPPAQPQEVDLKALRQRIMAAVSADTAKQQAVISRLTEAGLSRLRDADAALLNTIAAEVGA